MVQKQRSNKQLLQRRYKRRKLKRRRSSDDGLTSMVGYFTVAILTMIYSKSEVAEQLLWAVDDAAFYALPYVFIWACWRTKDVKRLALLLGVYSIFITLSTALMKRFFGNGAWEVYDITDGTIKKSYPKIDKVSSKFWAFHGVCALTWLVFATWAISLSQKASKKMHRRVGTLAVCALVVHTCGALGNLFIDYERHTLLNKYLLFGSILGVWIDVVLAIRAIKRGDRKLHEYHMLDAFVKSLDGAGTIRTVALFQNHLKVGVVYCQVLNGRVGGICDWAYTNRMFLVMLLRKFKLICAARTSGDPKRIRNSSMGFFLFAFASIVGFAFDLDEYWDYKSETLTLVLTVAACLVPEHAASFLFSGDDDPIDNMLQPIRASWFTFEAGVAHAVCEVFPMTELVQWERWAEKQKTHIRASTTRRSWEDTAEPIEPAMPLLMISASAPPRRPSQESEAGPVAAAQTPHWKPLGTETPLSPMPGDGTFAPPKSPNLLLEDTDSENSSELVAVDSKLASDFMDTKKMKSSYHGNPKCSSSPMKVETNVLPKLTRSRSTPKMMIKRFRMPPLRLNPYIAQSYDTITALTRKRMLNPLDFDEVDVEQKEEECSATRLVACVLLASSLRVAYSKATDWKV